MGRRRWRRGQRVARLAGTNEYKWIHPFTLCRFLFVEHGPATVESSPVHYLLLIIPVTLLILGLGLIRYKGIAQRHPYLDWLGAGYVLLAIPPVSYTHLRAHET